MIRYFIYIIFSCLLLAQPSEAIMFVGSAVTDHCPTCTGTNYNVACADFEDASTGPCTTCGSTPCWTIENSGAGSVTFVSHPVVISTCTDEGSYAMRIEHTASSDDVYVVYNKGSESDAIYVQGWVDLDTLANDKSIHLASTLNAATGQGMYLLANTDTGHWHVQATYWSNTGFNGDCIGSTVLSFDTWYRIGFAWSGGAFMKVYVDGVLELEGSSAGAIGTCEQVGGGTYDTQKVRFGSAKASENAHVVYWDNTRIDTSAMPDDCQ